MTSETAPPRRRRSWLPLLPLIAFLGLAAIFWHGLSGDPSEIPSVLVNKPVPDFSLAPVPGLMRDGQPVPGFASQDLKQGELSVVNVWASWCAPCRQEHPLLMALAQRSDIRVYGINQKDVPENAVRFLGSLGQPFAAVGADSSGRVSLDWGVYGVPETFIVDGQGIIRFKWIGPLSETAIREVLLPEIDKAKKPLLESSS
ncbi:MAG: DsbE family thiol:disulfide interchange protein [Rhizobiales bacterium]|nr:DsbE family thiol:disulfide interchange protein [Hyphomicrobiales bacterium]